MQILRVAPLLAMLVLAGCSTSRTTADLGPTLPQPTALGTLQAPAATLTPASVPTTTASINTEVAITDPAAFLDAAALSQLSTKERAEAASAQFNALTFGRPGAPRNWSGDRGASGDVVVGPYVRVNTTDCRDFTHTVKVGGQTYAKKGTACRLADGTWSVAG